MKTSVILIVLLLFNTTALIAEPLSNLVKGVNTWLFISIEALLIIGFYLNNLIRQLGKATQIDFNNINLFATKHGKHKTFKSN